MAAGVIDKDYVLVPRVTTTVRNALTAANGMLLYDTDLNAFYKYENGAWSMFAGGSGASWGSITGTLSSQTDLATALSAKEDAANKSTSVATDAASNTKYPSVKAVYDWVTGLGYLLATTATSTYQTIITATSWGSFINGLTGKTTPVDADVLAIADSADSNVAKKLTLANLKAALGINDWVDYAASSTVVGWSSFTTKYIQYRQGYKYAVVEAEISGTSDATSVSFTIPNTIGAVGSVKVTAAQVQNNGSFATTPGLAYIDPSTSATTIVVRSNFASGTWTASGTKTIRLTIRCKTA